MKKSEKKEVKKTEEKKEEKKEEEKKKVEFVGELKKEEVKEVKKNDNDDLAQIEKLAKMLEKGILTKEEFDFKKKKILGL
jgi:hypothetical protein